MLRAILDILLPRFCLGCGREGKYICDKCSVFLSEAPPSKEVFSVWEYEGLMEKLIEEIRFKGRYHIIEELIEKALKIIELNLPEGTVITFVPMYRKKERERGFNQSELIAQFLVGKLWNFVQGTPRPRVLALLKKIRDNRSQVGLNPREREENVRDVFKFCGSFAPKNVLLVDDVYTTGATTRECVRVLRRAGVKKVWIFTLARKMRI